MTRLICITTIGLSCLISTGCSSLQSVPGKMKSFVFRTPDDDDPLADINRNVTDTYDSAQKELKKADVTMLTFARWREDMGDYQEAKEKYRDILADNPGNIDARLGIARVEYATGRVAEAVDILNATARKFPKRADVWMELGKIQVEREEWESAVASLTKAVDMKPNDQAARYRLGIALVKSNRLEEAQPHLVAAVGESAAMYNIGFALYQQNRSQEAASWFRNALNSHPDQRTKALSSQMLAKLGEGDVPDGSSYAFATGKQKNTIDVELTSYEAYREIPGQQNNGSPVSTPTSVTLGSGHSTITAPNISQQQPAGAFYGAPPNNHQTQAGMPSGLGRTMGQPIGQQQPPVHHPGTTAQVGYGAYNQPPGFAPQQQTQQTGMPSQASYPQSTPPQQFVPQQPNAQPQYGVQTAQSQHGVQSPQYTGQQSGGNYPTANNGGGQVPGWNGPTGGNAPPAYQAPVANPPVTTQPPQWRGPGQ